MRARATALQNYVRDKEMQGPMQGTARRLEGRIGQLLGKPEKGGRGNKLSVMSESIAKDDREDFRIIARALDGDCDLTDDEWRKSRRALIANLRFKLGLIPEMEALPSGIFRCIVADPPWDQTTGPGTWEISGKGGEPLDYPTMPVEQICAMKVAEHAADDAHLYLWTTNKYLQASYQVARAWGFEPSTMLVWCKTPQGVALGGDFRLTTEYLLYARRGSLPAMRICETTWFNWPRGIHSQKPREAYELIEFMTPAPYHERDRLELFARETREGWTPWGNEIDDDPQS